MDIFAAAYCVFVNVAVAVLPATLHISVDKGSAVSAVERIAGA